MKTLADVAEGSTVQVSRVVGTSAIKQRLLDMGIVRGAEIKVERYAPLMDPIHIKVKGYSLAIRVAEGQMVQVQ